jgi:hypothetical protein
VTHSQKFSVTRHGSFYSFELYASNGRYIYGCKEAAERAEELYGMEWREVFNSTDGIDRDEYLREACDDN